MQTPVTQCIQYLFFLLSQANQLQNLLFKYNFVYYLRHAACLHPISTFPQHLDPGGFQLSQKQKYYHKATSTTYKCVKNSWRIRTKVRVSDFFFIMKLLEEVVILTDCLTNSLELKQHSREHHHTLNSNTPIQPTHRQRQSNTQQDVFTSWRKQVKRENGREAENSAHALHTSAGSFLSYWHPWFVSHKACFGRLHNHVILLSSLSFETKEAFRLLTDRWRL